MQRFRVWWNSFKTVALLISFAINMVALVALLLLLMQLFQIKNGILEPLVDGLHRNFVGLDEAVILRTIDVDDEIPVIFDLPLNQTTDVVLTEDVPLFANATFTLPRSGAAGPARHDCPGQHDHPGPPAGGRRNPAQRDPTSRSIRQSA